MKIGVYAGSFDPITKGHYDVIKKSLKITKWTQGVQK